MKHDTLVEPGLGHAPCRYGTSRLLFRGPRRALDGRHLAFVGGTETFGKFMAEPYPALVEGLLGEACVNFGQVNASVDAFAQDPVVGGACRDAVLTVMEVTGAQNMSNRFYTVHPRRNDRFVRAASVLRAIYPEVDFADFCFTRHMLTHLHALSPVRFAIVRGPRCGARASKMAVLTDSRSVAASITRSQAPRSASVGVVAMRARTRALASSVTTPLATCLSMLRATMARAPPSASALVSVSSTP